MQSILIDKENIISSEDPIRVSNTFIKYFTTIGCNLGDIIN